MVFYSNCLDSDDNLNADSWFNKRAIGFGHAIVHKINLKVEFFLHRLVTFLFIFDALPSIRYTSHYQFCLRDCLLKFPYFYFPLFNNLFGTAYRTTEYFFNGFLKLSSTCHNKTIKNYVYSNFALSRLNFYVPILGTFGSTATRKYIKLTTFWDRKSVV